MSDSNVENTNSGNNIKNGETSNSDNKPSITSLTHKLKAEALRRFKIDGEIENEGSSSTRHEDANIGIRKENEQELDKNLLQPDDLPQEAPIAPIEKQESASLPMSGPLNSSSVPAVDQDLRTIYNVANLTQSNVDGGNIISEQEMEANENPNESLKILGQRNDEDIEPSDQHTSNSSSIPKDNASYPSQGSVEDKYLPIEETRSDIMPSDVANTIHKIEDQNENSEKNNHFSTSTGENDALQSDIDIHKTSYDNGSEHIDRSSKIQIAMTESSTVSNIDDQKRSQNALITETDKVMEPLDPGVGNESIKFEDDHSISDDKMPLPENKESSMNQEIEDYVAIKQENASSNEMENYFNSGLNETSTTVENKDDDKNKGLEQNILSGTKNVDGGSLEGNNKGTKSLMVDSLFCFGKLMRWLFNMY